MAKKYKTITKVGNNDDGTAKCITHNLNDLLKFVEFLDKVHPTWTWFNVYSKSTREQLANFTKFKRPTKRFLEQ